MNKPAKGSQLELWTNTEGGNNEQNSELIIASTGPMPSGVQDSEQSTMPSESKLTQVQQEYRT